MNSVQIKILENLAKKHGISKAQAIDITNCYFKTISNVISHPTIRNKNGTVDYFNLNTINIKHFGKFIPKSEKRVEAINNKKLKKCQQI